MKGKPIYDNCQVYETDHFTLRLVEAADAEDLLECYSDAQAVRFMNADNCTSDFRYNTLDQMKDCIQDWLMSYGRALYVRFSIFDRQSGRAVGTIEMYDKNKDLGILRLDLCSDYEMQDHIAELLTVSVENFYGAFNVHCIAVKAIPTATERIAALLACGFAPAERRVNGPHGDYYVR